jgi:hypothetical protein
MLEIFNNYWILGISIIILYIVVNKIIYMDCDDSKKKKFNLNLDKNIPIIASYYIGLH